MDMKLVNIIIRDSIRVEGFAFMASVDPLKC